MARSTTVFGVLKVVGHPKTGIFRGICLEKCLARKMQGRHDTEVVERGKLHLIRVKRVLRQKYLMTLESPGRCRTAEIDTDRDVWPREFLPRIRRPAVTWRL